MAQSPVAVQVPGMQVSLCGKVKPGHYHNHGLTCITH